MLAVLLHAVALNRHPELKKVLAFNLGKTIYKIYLCVNFDYENKHKIETNNCKKFSS